MKWSRSEKLILIFAGFSVVSITAFVLILWAGKKLAEPPEPGEKGFAAYREQVGRQLSEGEMSIASQPAHAVARDLKALRFELGRDRVEAEGRVVTVAEERAGTGGRHLLLLESTGKTWLHCFFEPDEFSQLAGLERGTKVRIRGLAADWYKGKKGLYLCQVASRN